MVSADHDLRLPRAGFGLITLWGLVPGKSHDMVCVCEWDLRLSHQDADDRKNNFGSG